MKISQPSIERFGKGSFVGDIMKDDTFFDMSPEDKARFLGQRAGCPVVEELINPDTGRGSEKMANRYAEVNFWYGFLSREIEHYNKSLFKEFSKATSREEGEPVGKYEPESVPENYTQAMAPMNSLPGFSLPRMFIEQIQSGEDKDEKQQKIIGGLQIVEIAIKESKTPAELMARVAEGLAKDGVQIDKIIKQILGQGWVDEHNAYAMLGEGFDALKKFAPTIWNYYNELRSGERKKQGLVDQQKIQEWLKKERIKESQAIEVSLKSEEDFEKLKDFLKDIFGEEGSDQCVFVLKSMAEDDFVNHCNEATEKFGKELAEHFGGEESFFDIVTSAEFIEATARAPLSKLATRVDFHSVAVIKVKRATGSKSSCVIFDLTYNTVSSSDGALVINSPGNLDNAMKTLKDYYGGSWRAAYYLNKETGKFVYKM